MIVTQIRQFRINADTKEDAIAKVCNGEGILVSSQDVANVEGKVRHIAVSYDQWPMWAKALKQFSVSEDKGIGDVVLRIIGDEKSEAFKAWFQKTFNQPCGCDGRLAQWNALYPL